MGILNASKWKSAFLFGIGICAVDIYLMFDQVALSLANFTSSRSVDQVFLEGFYQVLFPHFVLLTIFIIFIGWLSRVFEVKNLWRLYTLSSIYIGFVAILHFPQIVHPNSLNWLLPLDRTFLGVNSFVILCLILLTCLLIKARKVWQDGVSVFRKLQLGTITVLCGGIFFLNGFLFINSQEISDVPREKIKVQIGQRQKNIIVISVDALNVDADPIIQKFANHSLKRFLAKSVFNRRTIADVAQTHGSFASIFSGRRPYETQVRYPFHNISTLADQGSLVTLKELKDKGYQISISRDEMVTAPFFPGNVIDRVLTPNGELNNNKFGLYYIGILTYGIFDNFIGHFVFPEAYSNSMFQFAKAPQATVSNLRLELRRISYSKRPEFLFFHTCMLHSPLQLPYPYYLPVGFDEDGGPRFGYPTLYKRWAPNERSTLQAGAPFNQKYYDKAVEMLTKEMLNPLFSEIEQDPAFDNSTVMLISDHGENLWASHDKPVGNVTVPYHGDTLLFGSRSEFSYFRYSKNNKSGGTEDVLINLSQNFRNILDLNFDPELVYSENAYYLYDESPSLVRTLSNYMIAPSLKNSGVFNYLVSSENLLAPAVVQKQRSVYWGNFKLTQYSTLYGKKHFLCDFNADTRCEHNLFDIKNYLSSRDLLLSKLKTAVRTDEKNGLDVLLQNEKTELNDVEQLSSYMTSKNLWIQYYGALILYYQFHDFKNALSKMYEIYSETEDENLKLNISLRSRDLCLYNDEIVTKNKITMFLYSTEAAKGPGIYRYNSEFFFCSKDGYDTAGRGRAPPALNWIFDSVENLEKNFSVPEAGVYLKNLRHKYKLKHQLYVSDIFRNLPLENRATEARAFIKYLKDRYSYFVQYNLPEELDPYFFLKVIVFDSAGLNYRTEILSELTSLRASALFETLFFNSLEVEKKLTEMKTGQALKDFRNARLRRLLAAFKIF